MRFDLTDTSLPGVKVIQRRVVRDERGYLARIFCTDDLKNIIAGRAIVQINHTLTVRQGAVRGMHYQQPPHAEAKFITCVRGEIFDVAVDLRRGSPTFLHWHGEVLSDSNQRTMFIPEGFAHGFQTMKSDCELLYLHTAAYAPASEGGLRPDDPRIGVIWPQPIGELSSRDAGHPLIDAAFRGLEV